VLYGGISLLGFLAEPTRANVFAVAGYVVVVTGLTAFLHWVITDRLMCANRLSTVALAAAGLPMALSAIFTLGPAGLAVGLLLLALGATATIDPLAAYLTSETRAEDEAATTPVAAQGPTQRPALEAMSTSGLTTQWGACGTDLDGVRLRADILDELERRDPAGVARWIQDGDAASPAGYVRDDGLNA
jgi:hypothetical protein